MTTAAFSESGKRPVRILVVDDSPAMQELMKIVIEAEPDLALAGIAKSAEEGWGVFTRVLPDVVALDLELPGRPGIDLLKRIIKERPTPVVIVSANGGTGSAETINALSAGAVAFIDKPDTINLSFEDFRVKLVATLRECVESANGLARLAPRIDTPIATSAPRSDISRDRVLAIGASTGGVVAIQKLLGALGQTPVAVVITQHMPAGYTARFADRLQQVSQFQVREAQDGEPIRPGHALVAPGDRHLAVIKTPAGLVCKLLDGPLVSGHRPSVDVLYKSLAQAAGARAIGVLLTGMGRDGADGLLELKKAGAQTMVENDQTAVVFGMPRVALEIGASADALPLPQIGQWVTRALSPGGQQAPQRTFSAQAGPPAMGKDLRNKPIDAFRVLVVDDQKSMRGLAAMSLRQLGFQRIDEADSGEEALAAVKERDYDLMLLDWNMDGMSGIDTLKAVRRERDPRSLVVIMTTSENHIGKVHEATQAGANNYLVKPCAADRLKQRLERALMRMFPPIAA